MEIQRIRMAWETVIDQRITDFKAGKIKSVPANEVFARIEPAAGK